MLTVCLWEFLCMYVCVCVCLCVGVGVGVGVLQCKSLWKRGYLHLRMARAYSQNVGREVLTIFKFNQREPLFISEDTPHPQLNNKVYKTTHKGDILWHICTQALLFLYTTAGIICAQLPLSQHSPLCLAFPSVKLQSGSQPVVCMWVKLIGSVFISILYWTNIHLADGYNVHTCLCPFFRVKWGWYIAH